MPLTLFPGGLRQAGAGPAELLRAVPEDLRRRPGPEDVKGEEIHHMTRGPLECIDTTF